MSSIETNDGAARASCRAVLRDGRVVTICEVQPGDEPLLREFLDGLCLDARRLRFFTVAADVDRMAGLFAASGGDRIGLVALDEHGGIVGHALAIELGDARAEVAVEVADDLHGDGLGTVLLERLAQMAERREIATFVASVLPENHAMLDVFRDGFDARVGRGPYAEAVEFPTSAWRRARERYGT